MKKLLLTACVAALTACSAAKNDQITAHINGWGDEMVEVIYWNAKEGAEKRDSVQAHGGRFTYKSSTDTMTQMVFYRRGDLHTSSGGHKYLPVSRRIEVLHMLGDRLRLKGVARADKVVEYDVRGTEAMEGMSDMRRRKLHIMLLRDSTEFDLMATMDRGGSEEEQEVFFAQRRKLNEQIDDMERAEIRKNPRRNSSALFVINQPIDSLPAMYALLSPEVKNGVFKPLLDARTKEAEFYNAYQKYNKKEFAGELAPDFTLMGLDGKPFTLSQFDTRDKFVVLDFWGSWCGPCMMGVPAMKKYYDKYRRLEIVSINCNEKPEAWRAAVAANGMNWINVIDDKSTVAGNVAVHYGVGSYPTKIILSPDLRMLFRFEGEGVDFYEKLDELLR